MPYRDDFQRRVEFCAQELSGNLESVVRNFDTAQEVAGAMERYGLRASDPETRTKLKAALEARTRALVQIQSAALTTTDSLWQRYQTKCELVKDQLVQIYKEYLTLPQLLKGTAGLEEVDPNLKRWKIQFGEETQITYSINCEAQEHGIFSVQLTGGIVKRHFWQRGKRKIIVEGWCCKHINNDNWIPFDRAYKQAFEFYQNDNMNTGRLKHSKENILEIIQIPAALQQLIQKRSVGLETSFDFL